MMAADLPSLPPVRAVDPSRTVARVARGMDMAGVSFESGGPDSWSPVSTMNDPGPRLWWAGVVLRCRRLSRAPLESRLFVRALGARGASSVREQEWLA